MAGKLKWGILATGRIAGAFANGVAHCRRGEVVAVGSRSRDKAEKFAAEHKIPKAHGSYEELLADKDVQAVYIATPHPMHAEWAIQAAEAGKHILCEKPLALNYPQAMAVVEAAREHDVFLMEAFMYRCHPQTARLVELIANKTIGEVRLIRATFSFHAGFSPESRLFANNLGGGGILDVGCYCVSASRLIAGVATGKDFAEPVEVKACGHVGATGVDEWAIASLKFPGEILAQVSAGVSLNQDNALIVFGTEGNIVVPSPWIPSREGGATQIIVKLNNQPQPREIVIETQEYLYGIEADVVAGNIDRRQAPSPAMSWKDTLGNIKTLDAWRAGLGQTYESERPENIATVHRRPLAVRKDAKIPYGQIAGVDKPVSRIGLGAAWMPTTPHAFVMFDDYFEFGGNLFDTAFVYGGGNSERTLGQWINRRGIRDKVVVLGKGAHTPFCTPKDLTQQLRISLERLGTDYVDIYMMHRDNTDVPIGEFVDVLNEHKQARRMRAFGGSNWTLERIEAFNAYAAQHGLAGFSAFSNNFSLADMIDGPWDGCVACSDRRWREWLNRTRLPVIPWSSLAQGFFARGNPTDTSDANLVRCWYSDENFRRLQRAKELAAQHGVSATVIALAYVLCQPFPTLPLIGPLTLSELRENLQALDIRLAEQELRWLISE